jgi:RNA-directed DNA polymerase
LALSLVTPEKIRTLQRKLYRKAKAEPAFRFYMLYDKICREDILRHAYGLARGNAGAPGVDGMSFGQIEAAGLEAWLAGLREELVSRTCRPDPVRRVRIPKPDGGGERALGIPTIRDRVVQTASSCWNRFSRRISRTMPTAIALLAGRWMRSRKCTG